jgi:hypothetical protein
MSNNVNTLTAGRPSARADRAKTLASLADGGMKRVNFELSAEQHTKLKIYAARQGKSLKKLLTDYVEGLPE